MTQYQLSFTDTQISILKTSLDMRIDRINDLIVIFSKNPNSTDDQWMVARYTEERDNVMTILQDLTNATSFLPTA
jgi:hypothetical protein